MEKNSEKKMNFVFKKNSPYLKMTIIQTCIYIYIYSKVKLATLVEGDLKAPFSIATTPKCRGGRYSFPWIAPLYP